VRSRIALGVAGLLVVEGRLVGIERPLGQLGEQRVAAVDREVVADGAEAAQQLVDHLLAVHRELQGQAQVQVVERGRVAMGDEHIVAPARTAWISTPGVRLIRSTTLGSTRLMMSTRALCKAAMRAVLSLSTTVRPDRQTRVLAPQ
jgi:hypothetical protein